MKKKKVGKGVLGGFRGSSRSIHPRGANSEVNLAMPVAALDFQPGMLFPN